MTEKRFTTKNIINSSYCVWDNDDNPYGNDEVVDLLNDLHDENAELKKDLKLLQDSLWTTEVIRNLEKENKELKQQNKELKSDNDIKFWKHQFMMRYNTTQLIMHELSKAIENGYEISSEYKKYLNELKVQHDENKEKIERLGL